MFRNLLLIFALLALAACPVTAGNRTSYHFNKRSEIKASEFRLVAFDISNGTLYFNVDGNNLYYHPDAESASTRISTITALLAELRHARLVVVTYCDEVVKEPDSYPGERLFPAVEPMKGAATYRSVGGFWLEY